jgi:hypothetical protein
LVSDTNGKFVNYKIKGVVVEAQNITIHSLYNPKANTPIYDISVIKLKTYVNQTANIKYITPYDSSPTVGQQMTISGWGLTASQQQRYFNFLIKIVHFYKQLLYLLSVMIIVKFRAKMKLVKKFVLVVVLLMLVKVIF